jgi:uroporphyrinogen decarboxylase
MFDRHDVWHRLMQTLTEVVIRYLKAQMAAGVQVVQLFDSWVGTLSPTDFQRWVLPHTARIFSELRPLGVPTIYFGTGTGGLLELMGQAGSDLVGVDWRVCLDDAWARIGDGQGIQGNLDPAVLCADFEMAEEGARDVLRRAGGRLGHVFNLGHGVLPETPPQHLERLVDFVHRESQVPHT